MRRKILLVLLLTCGFGVGSIFGALQLVRHAASGRTYSDPALIPHRHVGLVLGCSRHLGNGDPNPFFDSRIQAAVTLFRTGKIDYLLVSGDNHTHSYDEATDMQNGLLAAGIPAEKIYCDFAGFRTLDSMVRAKTVFGQKEITVISQEFHNQRAIFLARHAGLDAIGFNAAAVDPEDYSGARRRERLARVKAVLDVFILRTKPKFLGASVNIGTDAPTSCAATADHAGASKQP